MRSRWVAPVAAAAALALSGGCVQFFEGEVQGFVRDEVNEVGLNGATVKVYYDHADAGSYQLTFTQTNADAGFFIFRRIVWSTQSPWFGDEGDLHDVRITVEHEDYQPLDAAVRLVSGAASSVGDLYLKRAFFESGVVEGRLLDAEEDADGEHPGINGLTVQLYVPDVAIDSQAQAQAWVDAHTADQVVNTATADAEAGHFSFSDVRWKTPGQLPQGGEDERGTPWNVILRIEDPDHFERLLAPVQIVSGEVGTTLDDAFITKRDYSGDLEGWVTDVADGDGINGVSVDVYVPTSPLADAEAVRLWVDEHDPDSSGTTATQDNEDGHFLITGIDWEEATPPTVAHPREAVIVVFDAGAYREEILYLGDDGAPLAELVSTRTVDLGEVRLARTQFLADLETYVRSDPTDPTSGENGVEVFLYYDKDDPDLSELADFDPETVSFSDRTTTGDRDIGGELQAGYFRFDNLGWDNDSGGALGGGRDELVVILYSRGVDFSDLGGNTDPTWQRFTLVSAVDEADTTQVNTLPGLQYRPTRFDADLEGFVRRVIDDPTSGANGVELKLYYDPNDSDLSGLGAFDPAAVDFVDVVTTRDDPEGDAGLFSFAGLGWRNPDGPSVAPDRDRLTLIVYSEEVNFSGFAGNTDKRWQRFVITSGDDAAALPDLLHDPTDFRASFEGYVRATRGDVDSGANGVALSLWYDPDDPDLIGFTDFDPTTASPRDRATTGTVQVGDQSREGYYRFDDLLWRDPAGGSLGNGRDQLRVVLYSDEVDFSGLAGNTDSRWQVFTLVSGPEGNTLPDLSFDPPPAPFEAAVEGYVRQDPDDATTGRNGVPLYLYYDGNDPDLAAAATFDPATAAFTDYLTTSNQAVGGSVWAGHFTFEGLSWLRDGGATLSSGRDTLRIIVYSEHVDFSAFDGNTDSRWQVFTVVSGQTPSTLPELVWAP